MNNLFKNNSRFASLAHEEPEDKTKKDNNKLKKDNNKNKVEEKNSRFNFDDVSEKDSNMFKNDLGNQRDDRRDDRRDDIRNDRRDDIRNDRRDDRRDDRQRAQRCDFGNRKPEVKNIQVKKAPEIILTENDFPSTMTSSTSTEVKKTHIMTFAERASLNCTIGETIKLVKPVESKCEKEYSEKQMAMDVLDALCDLHERETERHIERYGYDAWERMNKFEGWEEEEAYNEKFDDDYNKWLEKEEKREILEEEEREREEEYLANNDRFVNYWKYY